MLSNWHISVSFGYIFNCSDGLESVHKPCELFFQTSTFPSSQPCPLFQNPFKSTIYRPFITSPFLQNFHLPLPQPDLPPLPHYFQRTIPHGTCLVYERSLASKNLPKWNETRNPVEKVQTTETVRNPIKICLINAIKSNKLPCLEPTSSHSLDLHFILAHSG